MAQIAACISFDERSKDHSRGQPALYVLRPMKDCLVALNSYFDSTAVPYTCVQARENSMKYW